MLKNIQMAWIVEFPMGARSVRNFIFNPVDDVTIYSVILTTVVIVVILVVLVMGLAERTAGSTLCWLYPWMMRYRLRRGPGDRRAFGRGE